MPSVCAPASLLKLSVQRILDNIVDCDYFLVHPLQIRSNSGLWQQRDNSSTNNEVVASKGSKSCINPFHQLPTRLLEQIIYNVSHYCSIYKEKKNALNVFLGYVISPQVRFLRILHYPDEHFLNLNIFIQFENLISLKLKNTEVGDKCLELVGIYCKNLRMLDLDNCSNVTDTSIQLLCLYNNGNDTENQTPAGLCKTLQNLLIHFTSVSKQGVQIAINNLPMLKYLAHETTFEVILELTKTRLDQNLSRISNYSFVRLSVDTISPYKTGSLGQVIQFCPSLTSVMIYSVKGLTDTDLLCLLSLKYLIRFYLRNFTLCKEVDENREIQITFKGGVVPILRKFRNSLEVLDVSYCDLVDIWTIFKYCPYLTLLSIPSHCDSVTDLSADELTLYRNEKERFILKNLEILHIRFSSSPEILNYLLSFPTINEICIRGCDTLTDEFLENAVKCHNFLKNVKMLEFTYCHSVTKKGIDALMTPRSCITVITIEFCDNLTLENAYEWHLKSKRKNWNLLIDFTNSDSSKIFDNDTIDVIFFE